VSEVSNRSSRARQMPHRSPRGSEAGTCRAHHPRSSHGLRLRPGRGHDGGSCSSHPETSGPSANSASLPSGEARTAHGWLVGRGPATSVEGKARRSGGRAASGPWGLALWSGLPTRSEPATGDYWTVQRVNPAKPPDLRIGRRSLVSPADREVGAEETRRSQHTLDLRDRGARRVAAEPLVDPTAWAGGAQREAALCRGPARRRWCEE
jgi:hypothetical protein